MAIIRQRYFHDVKTILTGMLILLLFGPAIQGLGSSGQPLSGRSKLFSGHWKLNIDKSWCLSGKPLSDRTEIINYTGSHWLIEDSAVAHPTGTNGGQKSLRVDAKTESVEYDGFSTIHSRIYNTGKGLTLERERVHSFYKTKETIYFELEDSNTLYQKEDFESLSPKASTMQCFLKFKRSPNG